ncbi:MAG: hypothetical protein ACC650_05495 [Gammaproteobacteria bacterium]
MEQPETGTEPDSSQTTRQALAETSVHKNREITNTETAGTEIKNTAFFPVSEGKLITLYILSFGLYGVYWFYRNWKLQQPTMSKNIYPVWRAIFSIFFTHSLFKRINQQASNLEEKHRFNANAFATFFVVTIIASNVVDRLVGTTQTTGNIFNNTIIITSLVLFILSVIPIAKAQATVNRINNDMLGYLNHKYSLANYVLIALGSIFWILLVLEMLFDFMGIAAAE